MVVEFFITLQRYKNGIKIPKKLRIFASQKKWYHFLDLEPCMGAELPPCMVSKTAKCRKREKKFVKMFGFVKNVVSL
jgi:hypothetical protein